MNERPTEPWHRLSLLGFFATAAMLLPWCFWLFVVEREIYSRIPAGIATLFLWAAIQAFYAGARSWLRAPKTPRAKLLLGLSVASIGFVSLIVVPSILLCYLACEALHRGTPIGRLQGALDSRSARLAVVASCILLLFPAMNSMYFLPGALKHVSPAAAMENSFYAVNSEGFRGALLPREKPAGSRRIVFLGDSTTFGWPYRHEEAFPHLVGELLAARSAQPVEVINAGVGGQSLVHMQHRLHTVLSYEPDVAVLMYGVHHPGARDQAKDVFAAGSFDDHGFVWRFHPPMLGELTFLAVLSHPIALVIGATATEPGDEEKAAEQDLNAGREALLSVIGRLRSAGVEVLLLEYPSPVVKPEVHAMQRAAAEQPGVRFLPLLHLFEAGENFSFGDEIHPDKEGHRWIAEAVADALMSGNGPGDPRP